MVSLEFQNISAAPSITHAVPNSSTIFGFLRLYSLNLAIRNFVKIVRDYVLVV